MVLNHWESQFASLYNPTIAPDHGCDHVPQVTDQIRNDVPPASVYNIDSLNADIGFDEVRMALLKAINGKAVGMDELPVEILRNDTALAFLYQLFQKCFKSGTVPSIWLKSIINPIPKNSTNDPCDPMKYRGISLASCVYKLYCGILNSRLQNWAEDNNVLTDTQNGFRRGRSCIDHISSLYNIIDTRKKRKLSTYAAFVDFAKAFDALDRQLLWHKLEFNFGLGYGNFMKAIYSIYTNVQACVRVNGILTNWFNVNSGVKQGCLLSPLLFSFYINDLAFEMEKLEEGIDVNGKNVCILMYADDIVLISKSETGLSKMIKCLHTWCIQWKLRVNTDKTKVMHFRPGPKTKRTKCSFMYGDCALDIVSSYTYLGLLFNELLDMSVTCKEVAKSANRALGLLIAKSKMHGGMPFETFTKLYDSLVQPILDYSAGIWGINSYSCINAVQRRAERYFLGVGKYTPNAALEGELGWKPPEHRHWVSVFRLWMRLKLMKTKRINHAIFSWSLNSTRAGIKNWGFRVKKFLHCLNMEEIFNFDPNANFKATLKLLDISLHDYYSSQWLKNINSKLSKHGKGNNKLRTYSQIKHVYATTHYVKTVKEKQCRSALAKFRCGVAPLELERGRYKGIKVEDRLCKMCDINEVEDECHTLIRCDLFSDIRSELFTKCEEVNCFFPFLDDIEKMKFILSNEDIIKNTARACKSILNRRKHFIYN